MSTFQEKLDEFYLNYDTASLLKEDAETTEIVQMFKDELEYPEELTNALLRFNKTYLKSVVMRIKVRQSKLSNDELKSDILKYNKDLSPILDKLLTDKFKKQYEEVTSTKVEKQSVKEVIQQEVVDEEEDEETEDVDDEVVDDEEEELSNEDLLKQFLSQKVTEDDSGELKLVEIFESFNNYCSENEYEYLKASTFKKLLRAEWGKAEGKGEKSLYRGYQFC